jgi:hypothetical protein
LPEIETMLEGVAETIGERVHLGVGKAPVPLDIHNGELGSKLQSSLLKYSAHIYVHAIPS